MIVALKTTACACGVFSFCGGSGTSGGDFRKRIADGARKINYYTYAAKYAGEVARDATGQRGGGNVF